MKRLSAIGLTVLSASTILAACSGGSGSGSGANNEQAQTSGTQAKSKEPVELVFYSPQSGRTVEQFMKERGNDIQAKFPNYKIKFVQYAKGTETADLIASGQPLDIIMSTTSTINEIVDFGLQYDISGLIKNSKYDLGRLEPSVVQFMKDFSGGGMYGLPVSTDIFTLFYNKNLFDKFGVTYPKEGSSWDEIYELAKKMTLIDGGTQYYGLTMSVSHMLNNNQLSAPNYDPKTDKVTIEEDKYKSVMNQFSRFFTLAGEDKAKDMMSKWQDLFRKDQTAAMMAWYGVGLLDTPVGFEWDVISMPYFKEAPNVAPQYVPSYMEIASISKHKEEAFEVLAYLTSDEYQMKKSKEGVQTVLNNPDVRKAFAQNQESYKGKNLKPYAPEKAAAITPKDKFSSIAGGKAYTAFQKVVSGQSDLNSALREAAEAAKQEIEAAKVKK
ncbi:ABC transporter substrate-binding protein [Paenibacillus ginsengarvi]|uniref:Extracellular solute-binding protein n=1 Tax=Paenibacillus ginsengarvi TaxID=400777 RepID=A0A3B0BLM9_9BACL|nr:extracellular solute-binding protein [Paenibacillus ginsengarvi]RKN72988.1 extracellular solute-binding protein [Paenibacillus ginsengarvi]